MIRRLIPVFAGLTVAALVACSGLTSDTPTPAPPTQTPVPTATATPVPVSAPDAAALAQSIATAMENVGTFHVDMTMNMEVSGEGYSISVPMDFSGDFQSPDRMQGALSLSVLGFSLDTEFIQIGDSSWYKDPDTGLWREGDGSDSIAPFTPGDFLSEDFLSGPDAPVASLGLVGTEQLDGVDVWHYAALIPAASLDVEGSDMQFDMFIGVDDQLPRRITMSGNVDLGSTVDGVDSSDLQVPMTGPAQFTITLDTSKFGEPVDIEPPPGF